MKHAILTTSALVMLVRSYSPTEAIAPITPLTPLTARPPDYYQVIVTNNLFRLLGWTKSRSPTSFELISTVMESDSRFHKALIRNTRNRKVYYASIGELAGGPIVEKIEPRHVTLNQDGTSTMYQLPQE